MRTRLEVGGGVMRPGFVVACLAALLCGSCSAAQRGDLASSPAQAAPRDDLVPPYGQPAGYYPGRAEPFMGPTPELRAWLYRNERGIDEIQRRITQIRNGERAPGCFGEEKFTCVATLAQKLAIADHYSRVDDNIFAEVKYDVNGKPVNGAKIIFAGYPANAGPATDIPSAAANSALAKYDHIHAENNAFHFVLNFGPQKTVVSMLAKLPHVTPHARTQEDYDKTGVYEAVWAASVKTCPALRPDEVAKWVENAIKPNLHLRPRERLSDDVTAQELVSNETSFCGRKFTFHTIKKKIRQGLGHETTYQTVVEID